MGGTDNKENIMLKIGLIGAGALAHTFCGHFKEVLGETCKLVGIYSRTFEKAEQLATAANAPAFATLEALLATKPDYVIELAGVPALKAYAETVLASGANLVAVSAGALADPDFKAKAAAAAQAAGTRLIVPHGAIAALDLMQACALMGGAELEFETRKAPKSLEGAPGLGGRALSKTEEETAFEGSIGEAIKGFPKNVNVAVAAASACGTPEARMKLRSIPGLKATTHSIRIKTSQMHAEITVTAGPDPANPRTSTSTAWSVLAFLKSLTSPIAFF